MTFSSDAVNVNTQGQGLFNTYYLTSLISFNLIDLTKITLGLQDLFQM